ncbi:thioesterase-like superfamily-domain-containing protein [Crucibulum laeve]|uniref:Thioesterase-like superfamily-domain-containing protein n=1 Tax=Crucibulum laeve TaxID=68775 RepID=A0A5C3M8J2_9AGAR|nr:thioesterase-like superfamily-domain-containing protein [Crucibulum laeve]
MVRFGKAISVNHVPSSSNRLAGNVKVYEGDIDSDVPNGGYVLALIMEACIRYQSSTAHIDPIHVTAHYLRTTYILPFEVHVRTLKTGKGFTNLSAELIQDGVLRVTIHAVFGVNAPSPTDKFQLTLAPPSTYARRLPLYSHPSKAVVKPMRHTWKFHHQIQWAYDPEILKKNLPDAANRTNSNTVGGGGLEWGAWFEFTDKEERITSPSLVFLVDIFLNTPSLLPKSEKPGLTTSWFPTMTLSVEFKAPIPPPSSKHAARTVGLYSLGRFMTHPQGRHDVYVEVWTAPSDVIGTGNPADGWRDNQVCLATAMQMTLTLPMEANERNAKRNTPKL